jgi:hypothetical protein
MKKIFLLTLISVLFLSAFSQTSPKGAEILGKVNIVKYIDDNDVPDVQNGIWIFFWKYVNYYYDWDGNLTIDCSGWGGLMCWGKLWDIFRVRGLADETVDKTCETLMTESNEQIANGVYEGSTSKKIAYLDPNSNGRDHSYLIFQMNWKHDPQRPYNGKAEITLYKTDKLAF